GIADDDRLALQLREGRDGAKGGVDGLQVLGQAHADVAAYERRRPLGVEGNEVKWGALLPGRVVGAAQTVFEELAQEAAAARAVRAADLRRRQGAADGVNGVVVQLEKPLLGA